MIRLRPILISFAYVATYLLLEWLSYARPVLAPAITPWHPQAGLALAFLLTFGLGGGVVTAIAAGLAAAFVRKTDLPIAALIAGSIWVAMVSTTAAAVLRRHSLDWRRLSAVDAALFAGIASAAAVLSAVGVVGAAFASGNMESSDMPRGLARHGLADLNGMLMVVPLLMAKPAIAGLRLVWGRRLEVFAQYAFIVLVLAMIFSLPDSEQLRFLYLLFVPIIWVALRRDYRGALYAVLLIQFTLIFAAEVELLTPRFIDTQVLMLTLTLTALLLGAVVAERRRSEARLRERDAELSRSMRYAVAGELASATAHELIQPMTALVSYLNAAEILARSPGAEDERLRATVRKASSEALRASEVLHRLRNFYKGGPAHCETVHLATLCQAVASSFSDRLQRDGVALEVVPDPAVSTIEADETQLQIVLHNLVSNAIDAVAARNDVTRRIEIRWRDEDPRVAITVDDTGAGLGVAAGQAFEPFFTQKSDGMGLGLAISRSLVRAGGGEITAGTSKSLGGARFEVMLPKVRDPA